MVKLARVVMLAPVMAVLSARQRRLSQATDVRRPPLVPLFVRCFLACAALRTTGVVADHFLASAKLTQTALMTAAMFALGAGLTIASLRKVGIRPFLLALISSAWVAGLALTGVLLLA